MLEHLRYGHALLRLLNQHPLYQRLGTLANRLPARQIELQRLPECHLDRLHRLLMIEWQRATQHGIRDAPETPDVAGEGIGVLL